MMNTLGLVRYLKVFGMDRMNTAIPVTRPYNINIDSDRMSALSEVIDMKTPHGGSVPPEVYNQLSGISQQYVANANVIEPSSDGKIPWLVHDDTYQTRTAEEASIIPKASFLLVTENRVEYGGGARVTVYYIRGYTDSFGNVGGTDFNNIFHDNTMLYIDNISVVEETIDVNGLITYAQVINHITLINGTWEVQQTGIESKLMTAEKVMIDITANQHGFTNICNDISKETKLIDARGGNTTSSQYLKTIIDAHGNSFHDHSKNNYGGGEPMEELMIDNINRLSTTYNNVSHSAVPLLSKLQDTNIHGYSLSPNYLTIGQLKHYYPNIGSHNTEVFRQSPPPNLTPELVLNNCMNNGKKGNIAYQIGLKLLEFLSNNKLYSIHLYMCPYIDEFGRIPPVHRTMVHIISGRTILNNVPDYLEMGELEMSKANAGQLLYDPFIEQGFFLTVEISTDLRGIATVYVGFNHMSEVASKGVPQQYGNGRPTYTLEPFSTKVPLYAMSTIMPVVQKSGVNIILTPINEEARLQGVETYTFESIEACMSWCVSKGVSAPNNIHSFKNMLASNNPIIHNTWRVTERSFTTDVQHVLETITPVYDAVPISNQDIHTPVPTRNTDTPTVPVFHPTY